MAKNILIWNTFPLLERSGGPSTYLFHLRNYFKTDSSLNVVFLNEEETAPAKAGSAPKSMIPKIVRDFVRINQALASNLRFYEVPQKNKFADQLNDFDAIHFHSTIELYQAIPLLENFSGKVILTSHTPMAPHLEHLGDALPGWLIRSKTQKGYIRMDVKAFERADLLLFPAKEALEPYYNTWKGFGEVLKNKEIIYLPTGVPEPTVKMDRQEVFQKLNLPEDAMVICYAGRHNAVKGYDLLKQFGEKILAENPKAFFVILGKEVPMAGLQHDRWIEVGWTSDPMSYINASDVFVLPNRQTYFDLILLEVLSLGKRCFISDSGGNKFFKNLEGKGFHFFQSENLDSMVKEFSAIDFSKDFEAVLLEEFHRNFTSKAFGERYVETYKQL